MSSIAETVEVMELEEIDQTTNRRVRKARNAIAANVGDSITISVTCEQCANYEYYNLDYCNSLASAKKYFAGKLLKFGWRESEGRVYCETCATEKGLK